MKPMKPLNRIWYNPNDPDSLGAVWTFSQSTSEDDRWRYLYAPWMPDTGLPLYRQGETITFLGCHPPREHLKRLIADDCWIYVYDAAKESLWLTRICNNQLHYHSDTRSGSALMMWRLCFPGEPVPSVIEDIETGRAALENLLSVDWPEWGSDHGISQQEHHNDV